MISVRGHGLAAQRWQSRGIILSPFSSQDPGEKSFEVLPKILQKGKLLYFFLWLEFVLSGAMGPLVDFPSNNMPTCA